MSDTPPGAAFYLTEPQPLLPSAPQTAAMLERIPYPFVALDPDGHLLYANAAAAEDLGLTPQMLGRLFWDLLPHAARSPLSQACQMAAATQKPADLLEHDPDANRWTSIRVFPDLNGFSVLWEDVTERTHTEETLRRSERRFRDLMDATAQTLWNLPVDSRVASDDASWRAFTGLTPEDAPADGWLEAVHPEDRAIVEAAWRRALTSGETGVSHFRLRRADGEYRDILERVVPLRDEKGRVLEWVGVGLDLTEQRRLERRLQELSALQSAVFDSADHAIISADTQGIIRSFNPAAELMLGYEASEVVGLLTLADLHDKDEISRRARDMSRKLGRPVTAGYELFALSTARGIPPEREWTWVRKNGSRFPVAMSVTPLRMAEDASRGSLSIAHDITERKALEAERERHLAEALDQADRDPLTNLYNHRAFHRFLETETVRAHADGTPLAVAMLDMDNFKFFNTVYGHQAGDQVLRQVAQSLRETSRTTDILARFGGDEFALLLPGLERIGAEQLAATLRERMAHTLFQPPGIEAPIPLSLSIGVAVIPDEALAPQEAVRLADERLRASKHGSEELVQETQRLTERLAQSRQGFDMLMALVTSVDNKDRYTRRHSEDVLRLCLPLARHFEMSNEDQQSLSAAALLHDVGNIGISDSILRKPGLLDEDEWAAVRRHPMMGALIVGAVPGFENVQDLIRQHHERPDGQGYPWGLTGDEISLPASILTVSDAYCAMRSDRPYRAALSVREARRLLTDGSGRIWCARCVQALLDIIPEN